MTTDPRMPEIIGGAPAQPRLPAGTPPPDITPPVAPDLGGAPAPPPNALGGNVGQPAKPHESVGAKAVEPVAPIVKQLFHENAPVARRVAAAGALSQAEENR